MKKIFTIILTIISFASIAQTKLNTAGSNSVANINTAIAGSITAGGTDTYTATVTNLTWASGEAMDITFTNANTASSTFQLNGGTTYTLKKFSSGSLVNLSAGDISAGERKRFYNNGTFLIIEGGSGSGGGVTSIATTSPITGGTITTTGTIAINDAVANGTGKGAASFTASDFNSSAGNISIDYTNLSGTAPGLTAGTVTTNAILTGDVTSSGNATTLATVNSNVGSFGSATQAGTFTVNAKGLITAASNATVTPAVGSITGLGSGVGTFLATPSSANFASAVTDEVGTGSVLLSEIVDNIQTASYTIVSGDRRKRVVMNVATANTLTVPTNGSVPYPTGTIIRGRNIGLGTTTVTPFDGTVIITPTNGALMTVGTNNDYELLKTGTNAWDLSNGANTLTAGSGLVIASNTINLGAAITADTYFNSASYNIGIGMSSSATSRLTLPAGTTGANTAALGFAAGGVLETTIRAGTYEYNDRGFYGSNIALNRPGFGGSIADFTSDVNNSGTGETDLQTYTTKASTLGATGEKLVFESCGTFNDVTATAQLRFYFAGTVIGNTGALTVSSTGGWTARVLVIRTGSTTARSSVTISTPGASTAVYTSETDLTGLTFTSTNIIKNTGTAGGASGGSSDITTKLGTIIWWPAANN